METVSKSLENVVNSKIRLDLLLLMTCLCSSPYPVEEVCSSIFNLLLHVIELMQ